MMELNLSEEQYFFDINWYFTDYYNRLCVVASGGGRLPYFLSEKSSSNDEFHEIAIDLDEKFVSIRNEYTINEIIDLNSIQNIEQYFRDFDSLAKKGFYVYDKIKLNEADDPNYLLVAYPKYDTRIDPYPINPQNLRLIPRLKTSLILRTNSNFSVRNLRSLDLINVVNNNYIWRK